MYSLFRPLCFTGFNFTMVADVTVMALLNTHCEPSGINIAPAREKYVLSICLWNWCLNKVACVKQTFTSPSLNIWSFTIQGWYGASQRHQGYILLPALCSITPRKKLYSLYSNIAYWILIHCLWYPRSGKGERWGEKGRFSCPPFLSPFLPPFFFSFIHASF